MITLPTIVALGLHLGSWHSSPGFNNVNPGLYVRTDTGYVVGAYHNSFRRQSLYAGRTFETADGRFTLTLGGVTGYEPAPVLLLVAPSMKLGDFRLTVIPKITADTATVLHLTYEVRL